MREEWARTVPALYLPEGWVVSKMLWSYLTRSGCSNLEHAGFGLDGPDDEHMVQVQAHRWLLKSKRYFLLHLS